MNANKMEERIQVLEELIDRMLLAYGEGCEADPPAQEDTCRCVYCTAVRILEGEDS